ncbi:SGNH/GDSL hydrolase family protein [Paraglaciecola sp.]|uniref:SGNH/GDSL hydrolase family protein n=1 Tax=Paraglaciecola sp. TaxID=1920173 RepID=UPI003266572B
MIKRLEKGEHLKVLTYGPCFFADNLRPNPWVIALSRLWEKTYPNQVEFLIRGLGGVNSLWGLDNLQQKVINEQPDIIMMEWAINDAKNNGDGEARGGVSLRQCENNLKILISRIQEQLPNCQIILWTTTPISTKGRDLNLDDYYAVNRKVANELGLLLIDLYPVFKTLKIEKNDEYWLCLSSDEGHLTRYGAKKIVIPFLLDKLNETLG